MTTFTHSFDMPGSPVLYCFIKNPVGMSAMRAPAPALLLFPGGGYMMANAADSEEMAMRFIALGFCVFILEYSVGVYASYPEVTVEASMALKYIRDNAAKWGIDPDRVLVGGFSAGAHMAALLGTKWHDGEIQRLSGCSGEENRPTALLLISSLISGSMMSAGGSVRLCCEELVDERTPSAFMLQSFDDNAVAVEQTLRYAQAMAARDIPFCLRLCDVGGHEGLFSPRPSSDADGRRRPCMDDWISDCADWFYDKYGRAEPRTDIDLVPPNSPLRRFMDAPPSTGKAPRAKSFLFDVEALAVPPGGEGTPLCKLGRLDGRVLFGDILDNADASALLEKHIPGILSAPALDFWRRFSLEAVIRAADRLPTSPEMTALLSELAALF